MSIPRFRQFKQFRNKLLPALCVFAALAAAILTVRANEPGSSAADETGLGNSYEYPNSTQKSPTPARNLQPKSDQQAGTIASFAAQNEQKDAQRTPTPSVNSTANPVKDRSARPDENSD